MCLKCGWQDFTRPGHFSESIAGEINSIQPIRICVVMRELTLESFRTENYSAKHSYARLKVYENDFARTNSDSNILNTVEKADRVDFLEEDCSTSTGLYW